MGRISKQISTGKPLGFCSSSTEKTMKDNAFQAYGINENDIEVLENKNGEDFSNEQKNFMPLIDYKKEKKAEQKAKAMGIFKTFSDDFNNSDAAIATKRIAMKSFVGTVKTNIDGANSKAAVDTVIADVKWDSV